ncbi:MAG: Nif11-like leader peptide family natural product precursor [Dehalococcoidia bacterium]|nr:Nif11-like leader peptide family natural product precursor [Dehalococcoidia bacterium]
MSLESVKSLVARMHKDPEFKEKLASNRDEALGQYDLTAEEKHAVIRLSISGGSNADAGPLALWN